MNLLVTDFGGFSGSARHPNVVQFLGAYLRPASMYVVIEFMDGGDLARLIDKRALTVGAKWRAAVDVCKALNYLHHIHRPVIIHRDLKVCCQ